MFSFSHVITLIGQQVDKKDAEKIPSGKLDVYVHGEYVYVNTFYRTYLAADPRTSQVPSVIYQHSSWHSEKVRALLYTVGLWNLNRFGVWTLPTLEEKKEDELY